MKHCLTVGLVLVTASVLTGCGGDTDASSASLGPTSKSIDGARFLLSEEPDGALGVIAARESAEDGEPLVMVGRIGGATNPWIEGRAAFTLLDASKLMVTEGTGDGESELCTGDCCALERVACTALVKFVDKEGRVVAADARELLGLSDNDMVVIRGKAKKDEAGNFAVLADGVYVR